MERGQEMQVAVQENKPKLPYVEPEMKEHDPLAPAGLTTTQIT